jgi:hypothetical protein
MHTTNTRQRHASKAQNKHIGIKKAGNALAGTNKQKETYNRLQDGAIGRHNEEEQPS